MSRLAVITVGLIVGVTGFSGPAASQERTFCNTCFRGKPEPNCCSFFIVEMGLIGAAYRNGERSGKEGPVFTGDLGVMFNVWNSKAIGGSFHLAADDDGTRLGVGPRYRVWLKDGRALDLSPRLMFSGDDNYEIHRKFPGFAFSASLSIKDYFSLDSYCQIIPYEQIVSDSFGATSLTKKTETGVYIGASGRSYLAPVVAVVLAALVGATWEN